MYTVHCTLYNIIVAQPEKQHICCLFFMSHNFSYIHIFFFFSLPRLCSLRGSNSQGMENESLFNERQSIRDSARQLKKYGSTCNHVRNNDVFIRHNLDQSDTLQGIALKYGCTVRTISISSFSFFYYFSCDVLSLASSSALLLLALLTLPHNIYLYKLFIISVRTNFLRLAHIRANNH